MTTSLFCPHCGAANPIGKLRCQACQQPLDAPDAQQNSIHLLNERYEILTRVGKGGFGAVYKARDTREQGRLVAVKQIILKGLSAQEIIEATDGFNREARILSSLSHPLLPHIFDRFNDPENWYLVMTFIEGQTLDEYLQERFMIAPAGHSGLPLQETLEIGLQLCDVLHYLHTQQPPVIFRDLKPGNIMRTRGGRLALIDFGIARHFKPGQARDTIPLGSPGFAAPEQYGRSQTTPQADIYSLGALLFCLLTGDDPSEHPFVFPYPWTSGENGSHDLHVLIQRMVALAPQERPTDIAEVRAALQRIAQQGRQVAIWVPPEGQTPPPLPALAGGAQRTALPPASGHRPSRRSLLVGGLVATGGLVLAGVGVKIYLNKLQRHVYSSPPPQTVIMQTPQSTEAQFPAPPPTPGSSSQFPVPAGGAIYWSQDLNYVAIADPNRNQIVLHEAQGGQVIQTIAVDGLFFNSIVQWSRDNSKILVAFANGGLKTWNVHTGLELLTFTVPAVRFTLRVSWSPDAQYCALGYEQTNNQAQFVLLRLSDGAQLAQMSFPGYGSWGDCNIVAWSPDSQYMAFPNDMNWPPGEPWTVDIWNRQAFQQTSAFSGVLPSSSDQAANISAISWSPTGKQLATVVGSTLWLSQSGSKQPAQLLAQATTDGVICNPVWSPNEQYLAVLSLLPPVTLMVWDTSSGQSVSLSGNGSQDNLTAITWSTDSKKITAVDSYSNRSEWVIG